MQIEAYQKLFSAYQDRVYRLALRIIQDEAIAKDITQEVHIKCWQHRKKLEETTNPGAWIMRVTRNQAIDQVRGRRPVQELEKVAYSAKTGQPSPARSAELGNMMDILRKLVAELPEKQRSVFQLREIEGLQYKEIAEVMDIQLNDVKIALHRARQKIKERLIKVGDYGLSSPNTGIA